MLTSKYNRALAINKVGNGGCDQIYVPVKNTAGPWLVGVIQ